MTVRARSNTSVNLPVSGEWVIDVRVLDADGCGVDTDVPVVTVTLPTGGTATPTPEANSGGLYRVSYVVGTVGRYVARVVTTTHGAADFTAYVTATVAGTAMPAISDLDNYMVTHSFTDDQLQEALDAEAAAQRRVCKVPAAYPADLRSALLRRGQFHLAMMKYKVGIIGADNPDVDPTRVGFDSEVRRLEGPYRRLVFG